MITRITSTDLPRAVQRLQTLVSQINIRTGTSTKRIAKQILDDSLNIPPMAPEDTGALRSTGRVEPVQKGHAVVYGGQASNGIYVDYADLVHDDMRPRNYKLAGSGPKFVETHGLKRTTEGVKIINADLQALVKGIFG